jgi:hypothetical protein
MYTTYLTFGRSSVAKFCTAPPSLRTAAEYGCSALKAQCAPPSAL